jgi:hypothetical protein
MDQSMVEIEKARRAQAQKRAEEEKQRKKELAQAKKMLTKEIRQAASSVRKKEAEVRRLEQKVGQADRQKDQVNSSKSRTLERFEQKMGRVEKQRNDMEATLQSKMGDLGEARGRLDHARFAEEVLNKSNVVAFDSREGNIARASLKQGPAIADRVSVQGVWTKGQIVGNRFTSKDGREGTLTEVSYGRYTLTWQGERFEGEMGADGKLYWSDGDIWDKEESIEVPILPDDPQAMESRLYSDEVNRLANQNQELWTRLELAENYIKEMEQKVNQPAYSQPALGGAMSARGLNERGFGVERQATPSKVGPAIRTVTPSTVAPSSIVTPSSIPRTLKSSIGTRSSLPSSAVSMQSGGYPPSFSRAYSPSPAMLGGATPPQSPVRPMRPHGMERTVSGERFLPLDIPLTASALAGISPHPQRMTSVPYSDFSLTYPSVGSAPASMLPPAAPPFAPVNRMVSMPLADPSVLLPPANAAMMSSVSLPIGGSGADRSGLSASSLNPRGAMPSAMLGTSSLPSSVTIPAGMFQAATPREFVAIPPAPIAPVPIELVAAPPLGAGVQRRSSMTDVLFDTLDKNHDGVVSRDEFKAAVKGRLISSSMG